MFQRIIRNFSHLKNLKTQGVSIQKGFKVTYPHQQNTTLISSLAACQVATLRGLVSKNPTIKLGTITFSRIESNYDLSHWAKGGGKNNKINDIFLEAQVETNIQQSQFSKLMEQVQNFCPVYQVITGSGVKVNAIWKQKKIE